MFVKDGKAVATPEVPSLSVAPLAIDNVDEPPPAIVRPPSANVPPLIASVPLTVMLHCGVAVKPLFLLMVRLL